MLSLKNKQRGSGGGERLGRLRVSARFKGRGNAALAQTKQRPGLKRKSSGI